VIIVRLRRPTFGAILCVLDTVVLGVVDPVAKTVRESDVAESELPSVLLQNRIVIHGRSPVGRRLRLLLEVFASPGTEALVHRADELGDVASLRGRDEDAALPELS
jgi:hypothetical protein